ncbi:MAG: ribosome small subunit-dependent GTPase A [Gammaproteobacteria bacterium]|nr:ribosome small subunit-dependent GTPase A [Gammaproteobacteria bacterium]
MSQISSLANLGWQAFFQQQLSLDEWDEAIPARVVEQFKSEITVATESGVFNIPLLATMPEMVVGDWLLLDKQQHVLRLLDRKTFFSRKAAGTKLKRQLISANVDTAFIMSSMNDDFNLNRIERFLALVNESGAEPVVLLSKSDLSETPQSFVEQIHALDPFLVVEAINCLDRESANKLTPWIKPGTTIAVLGSSGVGKSTLINTLLGEQRQSTSGIREDDDKGRHTTTRRSLISLDAGGMILDTPGMREIQIVDCKDGIATTFADIEAYAEHCKFSDCQHQGEPGCAVQRAIASGDLDQRRLTNYLKLRREEEFNSASLAERRSSDKALGKYYKQTLVDAQKLKGR